MFDTVTDQSTILAKNSILRQRFECHIFKQGAREKKKSFFPCLLDFKSPVLQTCLHITNLGPDPGSFGLYPTKQYRRPSATSKQ